MNTDTENISTSIPEEIKVEENDTFKWGLFIFFMALTPFIVILLPKIALPLILFGIVVFLAIFLFSDQKSNLSKNAKLLWQARDTKEKIKLKVDIKIEKGKKQFFFLLDDPPRTFKTQNFILNTSSEGATRELEKFDLNAAGKQVSANLVTLKNIDDLILILIDSHRFWCRPWNYQYDYGLEYKSFEEEKEESNSKK